MDVAEVPEPQLAAVMITIVIIITVTVAVTIVMVPPVMSPQKSVTPISAALVISVNPAVMLEMAGHPNVMPSPVPEFRTLVISAIADVNFQADRLRCWTEHRACGDQDRQ